MEWLGPTRKASRRGGRLQGWDMEGEKRRELVCQHKPSRPAINVGLTVSHISSGDEVSFSGPCFSEMSLYSYNHITKFISFLFYFDASQISERLCLMDCLRSSSDKKTLKRWFFIDKRVG
ncbi:hypothetical protein ACH5RR_041406 [Cinchona calisaya]|uniref:Uncharacterized protein n=1 Tax=Cinchona calisaya TaxID=153742 RepID=A0ABD2XTL8_9GENT